MNLEDFTKEEIISALKRMPSFIFTHNEDELIRKLFATRYETRSKALLDRMHKNIAESNTLVLDVLKPDYPRQVKKWAMLNEEFFQLNKDFSSLDKWHARGLNELYRESTPKEDK